VNESFKGGYVALGNDLRAIKAVVVPASAVADFETFVAALDAVPGVGLAVMGFLATSTSARVTSDLTLGTEDLLNGVLNNTREILLDLIQITPIEVVTFARLPVNARVDLAVNSGLDDHEVCAAEMLPVEVTAFRIDAAFGEDTTGLGANTLI